MPAYALTDGDALVAAVAELRRSLIAAEGIVMTQRPLAGQVALVTGASRGIGRAIALALARGRRHGRSAPRPRTTAPRAIAERLREAGNARHRHARST